MSDFRKLLVWRKAHALALNIHRVVVGIRNPHYTSLRSRMVRAAMSIPTNIVEGTGQATRAEFSRFVRFALNATSDLEYHLIVARDSGAIIPRDFESLQAQTIEIRKMLHGLLRYLTLSSVSAPRSNSPSVVN